MAGNISRETWVLPINSADQHIWLAELHGWQILSKEIDQLANKVIIKGERKRENKSEWPKTHFGD